MPARGVHRMMKSVISPRHRREPLFLRCGNVQVVFRWHGDRWKHEIMLMHSVDESLSSIFFRSVEGPHSMRGDAHWPCSPSLVELDTLRQPGSNVILAVGMAGRSHFSLSISALPNDLSGSLLFEHACRWKGSLGWIGSTYESIVPGNGSFIGDCLRIIPHESIVSESCSLIADGLELLQIVPHMSSHHIDLLKRPEQLIEKTSSGHECKDSGTIRWAYTVRCDKI